MECQVPDSNYRTRENEGEKARMNEYTRHCNVLYKCDLFIFQKLGIDLKRALFDDVFEFVTVAVQRSAQFKRPPAIAVK